LTAVVCSPRRPRSFHGFTLLELVMVMLVIAVLLGLTLPLASALAGRFKVGSARDVFINTYARARAVAVQFGREGRLNIRADRGEFWVEVDTGVPGAMAADTIGPLVNVTRDYGGVAMYSPRQVLCFDSRGLSYAAGACEPHDAIIVFARMDRADTVQLSLGGTVVRR
jgi:prepilin-type N-terminal cleavage/methylation domain-containing protein